MTRFHTQGIWLLSIEREKREREKTKQEENIFFGKEEKMTPNTSAAMPRLKLLKLSTLE